MTALTRQELEEFSDAAGRQIAETAGSSAPVAERHVARFQELMARRNRQQVTHQVFTLFDSRAQERFTEAVVLQDGPILTIARYAGA